MRWELIFDIPGSGRGEEYFPELSGEEEVASSLPAEMIRAPLTSLPEVSEKEVTRHFNLMVGRNYGLDSGPYPLGGYTMRHFPKVGDRLSNLAGFRDLHPLQDEKAAPSAGRIYQELVSWLKSLLGMDRLSLEPASDGQAELIALNLILAHLKDRKAKARTILVADNSYFRGEKAAQGLGFRVERLDFGPDCRLRAPLLDGRSDIAALFLSNPNCFGLWEEEIDEIVSAVHAADGLVVNHARNVSGFLTYWIPGEMGIDAILFPLGGVFGVPHFGGGPSVTAVGFTRPLADYLPGPETAGWVGQLRSFGPNWPIILRAYLFLGLLGWDGLKRATEDTVLAANYLQERCRINLAIPEGRCLNQFTAAVPDFLKETEIRAVDIARRLLDDGVHGPAVDDLPALKGRLSFEPTEGCTHKILNQMAESIGTITIEVNRNFPLVRGAPHTTPIAQPKIEGIREEMIVVFTPSVIHSHDIGCGCPSCVK